MEDKRFKLSIKKLEEAQKRLRKKTAFKLNDNNYKDYESFVLESLNITKGGHMD